MTTLQKKLGLHPIFLCSIFLLCLSNAAYAHHSHGNYQVKELIEVQGEVTEFHLINPHVWIFMDVMGEDGEVDNWAIEGGGPQGFVRSGWDEIAPGDNLTIGCAPLRGDNNGCLVKDIQLNSTSDVEVSGLNWTAMAFQQDFFRINFPHEPEITTEPYLSEYGGTFPSNVYTAESGDNRYSMQVVDFTDIEEIYAALEDEVTVAGAHNFWFFDQLAAISYVARQYRLQAAEVSYDAWHVIDGIEGYQLYLLNPDNTRSYVGVYRHDKRLYIMEARVPEHVPSQAIFQQSLHILDAEGERIRYRLLPNHSTERVEI